MPSLVASDMDRVFRLGAELYQDYKTLCFRDRRRFNSKITFLKLPRQSAEHIVDNTVKTLKPTTVVKLRGANLQRLDLVEKTLHYKHILSS